MYSVCVFVALVIQHAMCLRHIVICGTILGEKNIEHKMCVSYFTTTFDGNIFFYSEKNCERYNGKYIYI